MRFSLLIFSLLWIFVVRSQVVNIDRENGQDTIQRKIAANFSLNFSSDKQQEKLLELSSTSELDLFLKRDLLFIFFSQNDLVFNGNSAIENNGYFQFRFRDHDKRKIFPDAFCQYQWNGVLGLEARALGGVNARVRWLDKNKADLYTSVGAFYEYEIWNPGLEAYGFYKDSTSKVINREIIRLNTNVKFAFKIGEKLDFVMTNYVQFPTNEKFTHFKNPRWFLDCNLYFRVSKFWSFLIHYDHNFDTYRPLPIDSYYYNLNLGVQLSF